MTDIVFELDADSLSLDVFSKALTEFRALVDEVASSAVGEGKVEWLVSSLSRNSPATLAATPVPVSGSALTEDDLDAATLAVVTGLESLGVAAARPRYFTDRALEKIRAMGALPVDRVMVGRREHLTLVSAQTLANVESILAPRLRTLGTVEGRLESINVHGDKRRFNVYDLHSGRRIECLFGHRIAIDEISTAVERRVAVYGEIKQRSNGVIVQVLARTLQVLPRETELPAASTARGLFRAEGE